jgi:hypothetical protein
LKKNNHEIDWPSAWQFALSVIGATILLGIAFSIATVGIIWQFDQGTKAETATSLLLLAAGLGMSGILLLPSAVYSFLHLIRKADLQNRSVFSVRPTILIFALPLVLLAGYLVSRNSQWAWLLLPPLQVIAVGLPILWLVYLGRRGLPAGSLQRAWGVFGSGLALSPLLIMLAEIGAFIGFLIFGFIYLMGRPELGVELSTLVERLVQAPPNPEIYQRILSLYLMQPGIIFSAFLFIAVIVPLIEEALKPVGVWLLAGRNLTPGAGFVAGTLSGAGYALFESLANTSGAGDWTVIATARIGTGVIHILTAGLTGWGLASAWREENYLRLGAAYSIAVLLHGLWNALTLLASGAQLFGTEFKTPFVNNLATIAPLALAILALTGFAILLGANRILKRGQQLMALENRSML